MIVNFQTDSFIQFAMSNQKLTMILTVFINKNIPANYTCTIGVANFKDIQTTQYILKIVDPGATIK